MQATPLDNLPFVAEIRGLDLAMPLSDTESLALVDVAVEFPVVIFRDQDISDEDQLRLCGCFGEISTYTVLQSEKRPSSRRHGIAPISNVDENGKIRAADSRKMRFSAANELWHSDLSCFETPASISILYARESVPPGTGGETEFADMRAAYERFPASRQKELDAMTAYHSSTYSRRRYGFTDFTEEELASAGTVAHPLVRRHPATGRKSLFLSSHIGRFAGMTEDDSETLLAELMESATPVDRVYAHAWSPGDVVIWDNQCTMHRARPYDNRQRRVMQRVTALVDSVIPAIAI